MRSSLADSDVDCRRRSLETAILDPSVETDDPDRHAGNGERIPRFVGSKGGAGVWQRIISEMPPHSVYVEPFVGKGIVALNKKPAPSTIVIDADPAAPGLLLPGTNAVNGDAISNLKFLATQGMDRTWARLCRSALPGERASAAAQGDDPHRHQGRLACYRSPLAQFPGTVRLSRHPLAWPEFPGARTDQAQETALENPARVHVTTRPRGRPRRHW